MQKAIIYSRQGILIFSAMSQALAGFWLMSKPFLKVDASAEAENISALFVALSGSIKGIANPDDWKDFRKHLFEVAGVRSLKSFHLECRACNVEMEKDLINFIPTRNLGHKEGFEEILDAKIFISREAEPSEILTTLKEAVLKCK